MLYVSGPGMVLGHCRFLCLGQWKVSGMFEGFWVVGRFVIVVLLSVAIFWADEGF